MGPQYRGEQRSHSEVEVLPSLSTTGLSRVLQQAEIAVIGAGNMLTTQALTAGTACVLCAVGGHDQPNRVTRYANQQAALAAELDSGALYTQALSLYENPDLATQLKRNLHAIGLRNEVGRTAELLYRLISQG